MMILAQPYSDRNNVRIRPSPHLPHAISPPLSSQYIHNVAIDTTSSLCARPLAACWSYNYTQNPTSSCGVEGVWNEYFET